MKKTYAPPNVQLMTFRYRDQVVAASGAPEAYNEESVALSKEEQIRQLIADGITWDDLPAFLKILLG